MEKQGLPYKLTTKPLIYPLNDKVISTEHLISYVSELNRDIKVIGKGHNPLSEPVYEWLNELIPFKKRWFAKYRKILE